MRVGLAFLVATALLSFTAGSKQQLSGAVIEHLRSRGLSPPITMDKDQVGDKGEESREGGKGHRERGETASLLRHFLAICGDWDHQKHSCEHCVFPWYRV